MVMVVDKGKRRHDDGGVCQTPRLLCTFGSPKRCQSQNARYCVCVGLYVITSRPAYARTKTERHRRYVAIPLFTKPCAEIAPKGAGRTITIVQTGHGT